MPHRTVSDLMGHAPTVIDHDTSLREAARTMSQQEARVLLVSSHGRLLGFVTEGDLVRGLARGLDGDAHVADVTTGCLSALRPDDAVADALQSLRDAGEQRAPVLDGAVVVGVVAITDLALAATR
jgi:CBS domain-containing protein